MIVAFLGCLAVLSSIYWFYLIDKLNCKQAFRAWIILVCIDELLWLILGLVTVVLPFFNLNFLTKNIDFTFLFIAVFNVFYLFGIIIQDVIQCGKSFWVFMFLFYFAFRIGWKVYVLHVAYVMHIFKYYMILIMLVFSFLPFILMSFCIMSSVVK